MNSVQSVVLNAIKAQVTGQQYHIEQNLSDELLQKVFSLSKAHDVAHLVSAELISQNAIKSDKIKDMFKRQQFIALYRYERLNNELSAACQVLEEADIPYMPLKGSVLRQYYPEPWMRTSSDIDVLVRERDVDAAADALVKTLNYSNKGIDEHDVQMYAPSGVHFELHYQTIEKHYLSKANKVLKNLWDEHAVCVSGRHYVMSQEIFYFYHIAHMARHFKEGGCGIRFFLDMWILNHNVAYDEEKRTALLKAGGLLEFAQNAERLSEIWFGDQTHTQTTEKMAGYILNSGTHGNKQNVIAAKNAGNGGKAGFMKYLLFRPLHELRRQYRILYKHKWLYPFCQLHRWICLLFKGGISRAKDTLGQGAEAYAKNGEAMDRMMKELRLDRK